MTKEILEQLADLVWRPITSETTDRIEELVLARNAQLQRDPVQNMHLSQTSNFCGYFSAATKIPVQFRAYHAGPVPQTELRPKKENEFEGRSTNNHVFFSLNLGEVLSEYVLPQFHQKNGIYVLDLRQVDRARVQTDYSSEVIWNDKIRTLRDCYAHPEFMQALLTTHISDDTQYIEPFAGKPKEELRQALIKEIESWLDKYTIPFKLKDLSDYRDKKQNYILVPSPIKVIY